jgi:hypothetical protein
MIVTAEFIPLASQRILFKQLFFSKGTGNLRKEFFG